MWKTRVFKVVCLGLGYRFNPDRPNGRWLKKEDGEPKNWYLLVSTEGEMKVSEGHQDQCRARSRGSTSCRQERQVRWIPDWGGGLMPKHVDPPRFIRLPQVLEMTTLAKPTIYK